jgi:oxygen-dependent protoporphyrinogen oxidase
VSNGGERPVAVIGAGIAGLAAAWELRRRGVENLRVFEAAPRPGGVIQSEARAGFRFEGGPDSFLTAKSSATELCRAVGLGDALVGCAAAQPRSWILHRQRLEPLPEGWQFLAAARAGPVLRTRLLSWPAKLHLAREFAAPAAVATGDASVADSVRARFGAEVLDTLVTPLLAGVYGGDPEALSFAATLPRFAELAAKGSIGRALWRQARRSRNGGQTPQPLFVTLQDGMESLPRALAAALGAERLRCGAAVTAVRPLPGGGYELRLSDGVQAAAAAVIFAAPARVGVALLRELDGELAAALGAIPYASAATVHLAYSSAPALPSGFGFLAPRREGRRLLAATFVHQKFPHRAPPGGALLRFFYGGALDPEAVALDDSELAMLASEEARGILGVGAAPDWVHIHRWPQAMPQYTVGHAERLARIAARQARHPGLALAGAAYRGIGVPDAIASGQAAAQLVTGAP